jgi:hypothetical protein
MKKGILYWLGAIACIFPIIILDLPLFWAFIFPVIICFLSMFLPGISTIVEAVFWVLGTISILSHPFSFLTILFFAIGIYWLISTVPFMVLYWYDIIKTNSNK